MTITILKEDLWEKLKEPSEGILTSKNYSYLEVTCINGHHIFIGLEETTGLKCFMFMGQKEIVESKELPRTEGMEVRFDFIRNEENKIAMLLKLNKDDYFDVYLALLNDLIKYLQNYSEHEKFVDAFLDRLNIWKLFLDKAGLKGLSPKKRRGLFGELYFLKQVIIPAFGTDGLSYWVGPEAATHDFEFGKFAVEVKTSAGKKSHKIAISSEKQLDDGGYDILNLYQIALTVRKKSNPTLVEMVHEVESLLQENPIALVAYHNLLIMSGYDAIHEDLYKSEGYHVEECNIFYVSEGFPRIIGQDIVDGIGGLKYTVDTSACTEFKVEEEAFLTQIDDFKEQL